MTARETDTPSGADLRARGIETLIEAAKAIRCSYPARGDTCDFHRERGTRDFTRCDNCRLRDLANAIPVRAALAATEARPPREDEAYSAGRLAGFEEGFEARPETDLDVEKAIDNLEPIGGMSDAEYAAWQAGVAAVRQVIADRRGQRR